MNFSRLKSKLLSRHLVSSDNQPTTIEVKKGANPYFAAPRIESPSPRRLWLEEKAEIQAKLESVS